MIEKILERLETEKETANRTYETFKAKVDLGRTFGLEKAIEIVQEVAKEYGKKLNRCDTCNHYVADEVPPICYFCCKGMEDNYQQKGE